MLDKFFAGFSGLKLTIMGSASMTGIMAHYGFGPDILSWYPWRSDLPWWGNVAIYTSTFFIALGLLKED